MPYEFTTKRFLARTDDRLVISDTRQLGNTLFSGTIRTNLLMGNPEATEAQMQQALRDACADFVFRHPKGLDAPCSEAGGGLSEWQAQRIAIARALLNTGCILIFTASRFLRIDPRSIPFHSFSGSSKILY